MALSSASSIQRAICPAFAESGKPIPCYGTTHADHFYGTVPVCRVLTPEEVAASAPLSIPPDDVAEILAMVRDLAEYEREQAQGEDG